MFLNCGEFAEINSDLLATYLCNDLSKTYTNVLQITKFQKNHKKVLNARAGQTAGRMQIFFLLFTNFQRKNSRSADVYTFFNYCSSMLCGGSLDSHFPKRGDCVKQIE